MIIKSIVSWNSIQNNIGKQTLLTVRHNACSGFTEAALMHRSSSHSCQLNIPGHQCMCPRYTPANVNRRHVDLTKEPASRNWDFGFNSLIEPSVQSCVLNGQPRQVLSSVISSSVVSKTTTPLRNHFHYEITSHLGSRQGTCCNLSL